MTVSRPTPASAASTPSSSAPSAVGASIRFRERYGPWAVVTGASSGIGRAMALQLAERGVNVAIVARSRDQLDEVAARARQHGVETRVIVADLATLSGIDSVQTSTGDLDVGLLVASAGFGSSGPFLGNALGLELDMLDVNCRALLAHTHHFGQRLVARRRGGLILMASLVGFQGAPFAAHYAATKAYVLTLAEGLHVELAPLGVDVVASAPGPVHTGFAARASMQMGQAAQPEEVAQQSLDALGHTGLVRPGALAKLLGYSLTPLPRWARARIMGTVMRGLSTHAKADAHSSGTRPA